MTNNPLLEESENKTFKSENFSGKSLNELSFINCLFENCNFTESTWVNVKFRICIKKSHSLCDKIIEELSGPFFDNYSILVTLETFSNSIWP
ncbi:hypothetical protein ACFLYU_05430 [Candidatus Dependentiae bacterium]